MGIIFYEDPYAHIYIYTIYICISLYLTAEGTGALQILWLEPPQPGGEAAGPCHRPGAGFGRVGEASRLC